MEPTSSLVVSKRGKLSKLVIERCGQAVARRYPVRDRCRSVGSHLKGLGARIYQLVPRDAEVFLLAYNDAKCVADVGKLLVKDLGSFFRGVTYKLFAVTVRYKQSPSCNSNCAENLLERRTVIDKFTYIRCHFIPLFLIPFSGT